MSVTQLDLTYPVLRQVHLLSCLVMIGPVYKTYANGCWHKYTCLSRLRPSPMASALILQADHVCFRHMSLQRVL